MKKAIFLSIFAFGAIAFFSSCEKEELKPTYGTSTNTGGGSSTGGCPPVQCHATAASTGQRCQRTTTNCSGYCYQHD